jgi:naphthalene 1,2-dioxygenase system ferredoxin subunit
MTLPDDTRPWLPVARLDDLWEGVPLAVPAPGGEVALYRIGEAVYATDNLCSHGRARLCEGFLDGHEIECPLHQGRFDVRTGAVTGAPAKLALRCHAVKIEDGQVLLRSAG